MITNAGIKGAGVGAVLRVEGPQGRLQQSPTGGEGLTPGLS